MVQTSHLVSPPFDDFSLLLKSFPNNPIFLSPSSDVITQNYITPNPADGVSRRPLDLLLAHIQ
jgi:hypothetical protein